MPGLVRGVARTAVVAGTATAVSGRVQRRQQGRWAQQEQQQYEAQQQQYAQQAPPPPPPPAAPPAPAAEDPMAAKLEQLKQLGALHDSGVLTDAEFAQQKARVLA